MKMYEVKLNDENKTVKITEFVKTESKVKQFFIVVNKEDIWKIANNLLKYLGNGKIGKISKKNYF